MSLSELWELVMDREPGVLRFMGSQRVGHNWGTELNWTTIVLSKLSKKPKTKTKKLNRYVIFDEKFTECFLGGKYHAKCLVLKTMK